MWDAYAFRNQDEQFFISVFRLDTCFGINNSVFVKRVWSPKRAGDSEWTVLHVEASALTEEEEPTDELSCEPFLI